jgi:aminoglycoside phosphotransferase family enzyme/predicted kinase
VTQPVAVAETHISALFFVGDRAYKLKKPVRFGFLDFSTPERREQACRREVELNRRIAPDVYLGVAEVRCPDSPGSEHLVVMRRMPAERRLSLLVERGDDLDDEVRHLAHLVAAFHAAAGTSPTIAAAGTRGAVVARWQQNLAELRACADTGVDGDAVDDVERMARRYLDGREELFDRRCSEGWVRDGHGDLRAEDVFCLPDGPRVLDCIEFDDRLRHLDVLDDACFMAMDLEHHGSAQIGARFLEWWSEYLGETHPATLANHYIAYRALVRAKVACLRGRQDVDTVGDANSFLRLARAHLERGRIQLVLIGGLPGTGKSTLAEGIGRARGWTVLRSDVRRKELAGMATTTPAPSAFRQGLYDPESTARTYAELLGEARQALRLGEPVVLDASWIDDGWRHAARDVAHETASDLVEIQCTAPAELTSRRIEARSGDPSDATPGIARAMAHRMDAWPEAIAIDTSGPPSHTVHQALLAL